MSTVPLVERRLADLSDLEIADLTQSLKAEQAGARPLVSAREPIAALLAEYEGAATYQAKVISLERDSGFVGIRRTRGDGDCFYRGFAFAYCERLLPENGSGGGAAATRALAQIDGLLPLLDRVGFSKSIYEDFLEPFRSLLAKFTSSTPPSSAELLEAFQDAETSNSIVVFLRLLTSSYLQANADDFNPFLYSLEDDPRFFEGVPTMEQFRSFHVEAVNKEADHIQIVALTRALSISTSIAYLDQSPSFSGGAGQGIVDFHHFEEESEEKLVATLLYRPGHYDILYR